MATKIKRYPIVPTELRRSFSNEQFVVAWASSDSVAEVVWKLKASHSAIEQRCTKLRKLGVKLKSMRQHPFLGPVNVAELNAIMRKVK